MLPPIRSSVVQPYSDAPVEGISIHSYAFEEAYAEKIRALKERTSPREIYDVVNLFRNAEAQPSFAVLIDTIRQKCEFKSMNLPVLAEIEKRHAMSEDDWSFMLSHQLPALPPLVTFSKTLHVLFQWLESGLASSVLTACVGQIDEETVREYSKFLPITKNSLSHIEKIRFGSYKLVRCGH